MPKGYECEAHAKTVQLCYAIIVSLAQAWNFTLKWGKIEYHVFYLASGNYTFL